MDLEKRVTKVLRNEPVGRIKFTIDKSTINKMHMENVAKAIENGDIDVVDGDSGPNLGASYSSWMTRRPPKDGGKKKIGEIVIVGANAADSVLGRAAIFHESVHAMMDVQRYKVATKQHHEVVAYIADAMYLIASKFKFKRMGGGAEELAIYKAAFAIVNDNKMLGNACVSLQWSDCDDLFTAVKAHKAYH